MNTMKKRPRLELTTTAIATSVPSSNDSHGCIATAAAVAAGAGVGGVVDAGLADGAGLVGGGSALAANGLFLATSTVGMGMDMDTDMGIGMGMGMGMGIDMGVDVNTGAQIYLTICGNDDNSDESQEFFAIESIKHEPGDMDALHHALLPTNLQLPTGCEIYLVKDTMAGNKSITTTTTSHHPQSLSAIKLEPDTISTTPSTNVMFVSGSGATHARNNILVAASKDSSTSSNMSMGSQPPPLALPSLSPVTTLTATPAPVSAATAAAAAVAPPPLAGGAVTVAAASHHNVKLDAYKKRDDKRRATHNEVERRRRDKINCWIFKLKEMLPTEGNSYQPLISKPNYGDSLASTTNPRSNQTNGRTPPNDSKSQILIKACDYIKSMQNEIDNLRGCLREAEGLRLSNQALRVELDNLKQQQELQERFNTAGGSFNVTLNSLNSSATSDLFDSIDAPPNLSTVSSINFTKRGLMITDYDE